MSLACFRKLDRVSIKVGSLVCIKSLNQASFEVEIIPVTLKSTSVSYAGHLQR